VIPPCNAMGWVTSRRTSRVTSTHSLINALTSSLDVNAAL